MSGADIVRTLDELLRDDKNFDTRAGLRLYAELVRDAFRYIEDIKKNEQEKTTVQNSILTRINLVEIGLREFMELRHKEHEKAESERAKWRWLIITPAAGYVILEIAKWVFR